MSVLAVRLVTVMVWRPPNILSLRDRLEMLRIAADRVETKVVQF